MRKALSRPRANVWYTAPYYAQAKMICWRLLQEILPPEIILKKNESELWVDLINNSRISLKGCDNEDSLVGVGLDFIVPDEFALYKPHVWPKILRPMLADTQGGALFIGTPRGKNSFFELYMKGQRKENNWKSWQFPTRLNPYIALEEIEEARATLPDRLFKQEYEASFEDYVGLIYPEFSKHHIIEPTHVPQVYPRIAAIDPALSGTTACLKAAIDENGDLIIYDEYYEQNKRVSEVAHEIKEENIRWLIDPASQAKTIQKEGKLYSLYDEYADNGIRADTAESDVEAGINRVGEYFKQAKIKIFSTCKHLIYELERYHWSETRETIAGELKPKPYKKDDHLCLVGNTKILMEDMTEKPLKDIKIGEYVQTSNGSQRVIDSKMTTKNAKIWRLKLSNGKELYGTRNHPIYTSEGKKRLDSLRYGDIIKVWKNIDGLRDRNIVGMEDTMSIHEERNTLVSTLQFGKMLMAQLLKVCVSTIKMAIQPITNYGILTVEHPQNICQTIHINDWRTSNTGNEIKSIWREFAHSLKNGIIQKKVENGTVTTLKKYGELNSQLKESVLIAEKHSKDLTEQNIVTIIVNHSIVGNLKKIWNNVFVLSARKLLQLINTLLHKPVHFLAAENLNQKQAVYNLTIANSHNYYANGILVSNCDCLKYLIMSRASKADMTVPIHIHPNSPRAKLNDMKRRREEKFIFG